jgi:hypothetical protein
MINISLHVSFHIIPFISPRSCLIPWAYRLSGWCHALGLIKGMIWKMPCNNIQLLHFIECDMMCYGALKSNIDQGRRHCFSVLHNTSYCTKWSAGNCFITFNIPSLFCIPGAIFRYCLLDFFQIQKHMSWSI